VNNPKLFAFPVGSLVAVFLGLFLGFSNRARGGRKALGFIAILGALGQDGELAFHVPAGLNHGLTRTEIEEIMVHLCLYAGFPRAVDGMRATRAAFARIDARDGR
jgi:hypothetical protein